jgi:hypothetical protein
MQQTASIWMESEENVDTTEKMNILAIAQLNLEEIKWSKSLKRKERRDNPDIQVSQKVRLG